MRSFLLLLVAASMGWLNPAVGQNGPQTRVTLVNGQWRLNGTITHPGSRTLFPRAATLGRFALRRTDFVSGEKLEPIYLRPTQFVKAPPPRVVPS